MNIGDRIKARRLELKMSMEELGKRIGKNRSTILRYEKGEIENLPLDVLEPIAAALHTTPQYLMGWDQVQKKNDALTDVVIRMRTDKDFFSLVTKLATLDEHKIKGVSQMLNALL